MTMTNSPASIPAVVRIEVLLLLFLALGALAGGGALIAAPDGHLLGMPLDMLRYSPFPDFLVPGALLFVFMGVFPLTVAFGLWKKPRWRWAEALNPFKRMHWSWTGTLAAGSVLVVWIMVQVLLLRSVAFLHVLYLAWGIAVVILASTPGLRRHGSS